MQYFELNNKQIRIRVCSLGAELQSIFSKAWDREYIWQPGAEIFAHHSVLLFPNAGRIADDKIIVEDKTYPAMMHGFAKDMEFAAVRSTSKQILLELVDNHCTRRYFPFTFSLRVGFTLEHDRLLQHFYVENKGGSAMYYSLGAHPGFYCPIVASENGNDYVLCFDSPQNLYRLELAENTRLLTGNKTPYLVNATDIPLNEHFFDHGPILFDNMRARSVTLKSVRSGRFVELGVENFDYLCRWGAPKKMSVICIEPWSGTSDRMDTDHIWKNKPGIRCIAAGQTGKHLLTFRVG